MGTLQGFTAVFEVVKELDLTPWPGIYEPHHEKKLDFSISENKDAD